MLTEEEKYRLARQRVIKVKKFYQNFTSWIFTSLFLMVLFGYLRLPIWITFVVIGGWGLGIASEAFSVFGVPGFDQEWEERKILEEVEKLNRREAREPPPLEDQLDLPELREPTKKWRDSDFV